MAQTKNNDAQKNSAQTTNGNNQGTVANTGIRILSSVKTPSSKPAFKWPVREWSDLGNAKRFADWCDREYRWCYDMNRWYYYEDGTWFPTSGNALATNGMIDALENLYRSEAMAYPANAEEKAKKKSNLATREEFLSWAHTQHTRAAITNAVELSKSLNNMWVGVSDFDKEEDAICTSNGILWRDGTLDPHEPKMLFRKKTKAKFDPSQVNGLWTKTVSEMFSDENEREIVQMLCGSAVFERGNPHKALVIMIGSGDSGKTTFLQAIDEAIGTYGSSFSLSIFKGKQTDAPRPDLLDAMSKRFIFTSEVSGSWILHSDQIKRLTGNDAMSERGMRSDHMIHSVPEFTPFIGANELPRISGADLALRKRLHVLSFNRVGKIDRSLPDKLRREEVQSEILNWLLAGYHMSTQEGAWNRIQEGVAERTDEAMEEISDSMAFLADKEWVQAAPGHHESAKKAIATFKAWRESNGWHNEDERPPGDQELARRLTRAGWERVKKAVRHQGDTQRVRTGYKVIKQLRDL